jgi:hypothetical protein
VSIIAVDPEMKVGRASVLDERNGMRLMTMTIENPPSEFVDAVRLCILNKVGCSFLPKIAESAEVQEMQEETRRDGFHELYLAFWVRHRGGTAGGAGS